MRATSTILRGALALGLLLSASGATRARADALSPPPTDCPAGTVGRSARSGGYCAPTRCGQPGQECPTEPHCPVQSWPCPRPEPWRCEDTPRGLCVQTSVTSGSRPGPDGPVPWSQEITQSRGACIRHSDCPEGARCEVARRCVHDAVAEETAPSAPAPTSPAAPVAPPITVAPPRPANATSAPEGGGGLCAISPTGSRSATDASAIVVCLFAAAGLVLRARAARRSV